MHQAPPAPAEAAAAMGADLLVAEALAAELGFGRARRAVLHGIDLRVAAGDLVCLIGPSGSGKSTLLRALAGLLPFTAGRVSVAGLPPAEAARRGMIGVVFQDATLLPWLSARDNAAVLRRVADRAVSRRALRERADEMLALVGLTDAGDRRPAALSGGMRQRVAIARALALDPAVLLMDEPFGALDAITREEMCGLLLRVWQRTGKTVVVVTHSLEEAVLLGSTVHVLADGRLRASVAVELPRPRDIDAPEAAELRTRLRPLLRRQPA